MKILCFIDSLGSGGAQRQLVELAKGFKEKGYEVLFLTYHEINFFKPELDSTGIPVTTLIETNYFKRILKIRKFIRSTKPDSVIAFLQGASFMATIAGFPFRKWKLIVGERSANPNILTSKILRFYRWFHFFVDYVVANSNSNLSLVKQVNPFLRMDKLKVIYNIVNPPEHLSKINIERGKTKIVVAASYRPVKNLDNLIEAVNRLPVSYLQRVEVDWFGNIEDDEYVTKMKECLKKYNLSTVIRMNLADRDIFNRYIEADYVGLFSHYEGFPNTICEAMSLGIPVIVSRVSDIPLFIKEKRNGFTCDSKDIDSIKKALILAIDSTIDERINMGKANKKIAREYFSNEVILNSYLELVENEK